MSEWGKENLEGKKKMIEDILNLMREGKFKESLV